ncbi:transmembrane protein 170B isoform X2 [Mastacembelus armatus]|uniref:transmembrane protein 170B isoform X2 n=1 Tax=Mastacembelus armatus TaxID=205130 RepID=UPI000E45A347|nr:transmembrane protein 170B isoform X2 [Mastacembelus armatus]
MPSSKAKNSYSIKRGANPGGGGGGGGGRNMTTSRDYSVNLSVQQVLSLWVQGTTLQHFTADLSIIQHPDNHKETRGDREAKKGGCWELQSAGAAVAGVYRVAGKDMAPLEALVFGVGQTTLSVIISFSRILATL